MSQHAGRGVGDGLAEQETGECEEKEGWRCPGHLVVVVVVSSSTLLVSSTGSVRRPSEAAAPSFLTKLIFTASDHQRTVGQSGGLIYHITIKNKHILLIVNQNFNFCEDLS